MKKKEKESCKYITLGPQNSKWFSFMLIRKIFIVSLSMNLLLLFIILLRGEHTYINVVKKTELLVS